MNTSQAVNPQLLAVTGVNIGSRNVHQNAVRVASRIEKLKADEDRQLRTCEAVLKNGLETFFEVGLALLTIRQARLYREQFPTFEEYCRQRWGIGRTHAWHLIGAAERVKLLPLDNKGPRPANEFQVRPFLSLEPKAFPKAWELVVSSAKDGRITPSLLREVAAEMALHHHGAKPMTKRRRRAVKLPRTCSIGEILVLLTEARRGLENGNKDEVLRSIGRIESELLGTPFS